MKTTEEAAIYDEFYSRTIWKLTVKENPVCSQIRPSPGGDRGRVPKGQGKTQKTLDILAAL